MTTPSSGGSEACQCLTMNQKVRGQCRAVHTADTHSWGRVILCATSVLFIGLHSPLLRRVPRRLCCSAAGSAQASWYPNCWHWATLAGFQGSQGEQGQWSWVMQESFVALCRAAWLGCRAWQGWTRGVGRAYR